MTKRIITYIMVTWFLSSSLVAQTNDFYDDAETITLGVPELTVEGEIGNPGKADLENLQLHSMIVKETRFNNGKDEFIGAYRYDGYSLYDILNQVVLQKKNAEAYPPIIDLYVEVECRHGEKAVFSWGELYYPTHRHEIIIATQVARIVPSKTRDLWPLPDKPRLIVGADLYTERNLPEPVKITIKSYSRSFNINKGMRPMYADNFTLYQGNEKVKEIGSLPSNARELVYPSVFYGRGTGIHGTTPFQGKPLKEVLFPYLKLSSEILSKGFVVISGKDGYHAVFSVSEIFNRNDQAEFLIYSAKEDKNGGKFKVFPAADFFSDRAIKSVESIYIETIK